MNLLFYTVAFWPSTGGIETFTRLIAENMHERGHGVTVVTRTQHDGEEPFPFRIVRDPRPSDIRPLVTSSDIVHLNAFHPRLFLQAVLRRRPLVSTYHDLTMICPKGNKWKGSGPCLHRAGPKVCLECMRENETPEPLKMLIRPLVKSACSTLIAANVCISPFGFQRYRLARKRLIPCGIETSEFTPGDADASSPTVLFAGRLIEEKGCQVLIQALHRSQQRGLAAFDVAIAGDGPYRVALERLVYELGVQDHVSFLGDLDRPQLIALMRKCYVAVVPSLMDNTPLSVMEAMSCGLPVVASDVTGLPYLVADVGLTFRPGDADQLADALHAVLDDPSYRGLLARRSREAAEARYDMQDMFRAYHDLFVSLTH